MNRKLLYFLSITLALYLPAQSQVITTYAGSGTAGYSGDGGAATSAAVDFPFDLQVGYDNAGIAVDASGNVFFADQQNNVIRKVSAATGIITTVAGDGTGSGSPVVGGGFGLGSGTYTGDGGQATVATLSNPAGIAINATGDLYICDYMNSVIRKVNHTTNIITTVAGVNGNLASSGDGGLATAAGIGAPIAITFDAAGNYYIADIKNKVIRKVNASGMISTIAGGGTSSLDGAPATAETLPFPNSLITDASGNLYIADGSNRIRKVNASGTITTFAGNGTSGTPTTGVAATSTSLNGAGALAKDAAGNFYIVSGCEVYKINTSNIISHVAGTGTCGYNGDFGQATAAQLNYPTSLACNSSGDLFIVDDQNMRVRRVGLSALSVTPVAAAGGNIQVVPNPGNGNFSLNILAASPQHAKVVITNVIGQVAKEMQVDTNNPTNVTLDVPQGIYLVTAFTAEGKYSTKIAVQ